MTKILARTRESNPTVHCIASYLTANDVANTILAIGGYPIMACDAEEIESIVNASDSLVIININMLTQSTIETMLLAANSAKARSVPIILHPFGIDTLLLRRQIVSQLIKQTRPEIIKGRLSEINVLAEINFYRDSTAFYSDVNNAENDINTIIEIGKMAHKNTEAIIVITGKKDVIIDGSRVTIIDNGSDVIDRVSGAGCMTAGVIATLVGSKHRSNSNLYETCVDAVSLMSCASELAQFKMRETQTGLGCFRMYLIDYLSNMDDLLLKNMQNKTVINY